MAEIGPSRDRAPLLRRLRLFRPGEFETLPARVKSLISEQERQSEKLIAFVQLLIGCVLAAVYFLSPRPDDSGAGLQPVPVVLSVYLAFSLLRLRLAAVNRLPGWFVALSIAADFGLLFGLIWSFHIQYGEPPPFSLKAPTAVYVFVFIALRALRFDPRYVLAAGLSAATGWAFLTYAATRAAGPEAITHSFAAYLNDNKILIGAEVEKIFAILMVTGLMGFGVSRARAMLLRAVREESAGTEVRRFLSRGLAEAIASSETLIEAGAAMERNAAILFLDIRGFTRYSATVSPHEVVALLNGFHARIIPIIRRNDGVIDKFLGDGVMTTFGAIKASQTAAADALRALEAILDEAAKWQTDLAEAGMTVPVSVNAAAASGKVVFATLGSGDRLEYTVIGDAVNLAAKLEKHNKSEGTRALVPEAMLREARGQGYRPAIEPELRRGAKVAGTAAPVDLGAWT